MSQQLGLIIHERRSKALAWRWFNNQVHQATNRKFPSYKIMLPGMPTTYLALGFLLDINPPLSLRCWLTWVYPKNTTINWPVFINKSILKWLGQPKQDKKAIQPKKDGVSFLWYDSIIITRLNKMRRHHGTDTTYLKNFTRTF